MKDIFKRVEELNIKGDVDAQLKLQVDAPWPKEAECLEQHGLRSARTVLDIGTGNGYFLCRLAERYPDKEFTGIEASESLVQLARDKADGRDLNNIEFIHAECPTSKIAKSFDFAFARFALYAASERQEIMRWVHGLLTESGRMAAIELDVGFAYSHPQDGAWDKLFQALEEIDSFVMNADPHTGRKLPHMLLSANFKNIRFEQQHWYSSIDMTPKEFLSYWTADSLHIHKFTPDKFTEDDLNRFHKYIEKIVRSGKETAICPTFVASGGK